MTSFNSAKAIQQFGLTQREAEVYMMLLRTGPVTVGVLAEKLEIHKQSVYHAIHALEARELVNTKIVHGRKQFQAVNPEVFLQQNQQQRVLLERIVPLLQLEEGSEQHRTDIQVYGGTQAVQQFLIQQLKRIVAESGVDVIGAGGDDFLAVMNQGYFFRNYENLRIEKKIRHRLIMYQNQKNVSKEYTERRYVEVKFLSQRLKRSPMATQIWPDSVSLMLFGSEPQIIHIRSKKIRDGFVAYFEALWR